MIGKMIGGFVLWALIGFLLGSIESEGKGPNYLPLSLLPWALSGPFFIIGVMML